MTKPKRDEEGIDSIMRMFEHYAGTLKGVEGQIAKLIAEFVCKSPEHLSSITEAIDAMKFVDEAVKRLEQISDRHHDLRALEQERRDLGLE